MTERRMIVPEGQEWAPKHYQFAPALKANGMVWISGVVANQAEPGEEAMQAAMTTAFETIGKTLAEAGSGWDQVVDITSYHTDLKSQMKAFTAVKAKFCSGPVYPAWTAISITALAVPTGIVEIKVVALAPGE